MSDDKSGQKLVPPRAITTIHDGPGVTSGYQGSKETANVVPPPPPRKPAKK